LAGLLKTADTLSQDDAESWHIVAALVENKPGVLFRVTNLFRARSFNIESITVGSTEQVDLSRMTITTKTDERTLDQLVKQLRKLIDVVEVRVRDEYVVDHRQIGQRQIADPRTRVDEDVLVDQERGGSILLPADAARAAEYT